MSSTNPGHCSISLQALINLLKQANVRTTFVTIIAAGSVPGVLICTTYMHLESSVASKVIPPSRTNSSPLREEEAHLLQIQKKIYIMYYEIDTHLI